MKRLVKLPLPVNGMLCKSIEDVQENFNLYEIFEHFQSGKLAGWLKSRRFEQLEAVQLLDKASEFEITVRALADIFQQSIDETEVSEGAILINYQKNYDAQKIEQENIIQLYDTHKAKQENIIKDYDAEKTRQENIIKDYDAEKTKQENIIKKKEKLITEKDNTIKDFISSHAAMESIAYDMCDNFFKMLSGTKVMKCIHCIIPPMPRGDDFFIFPKGIHLTPLALQLRDKSNKEMPFSTVTWGRNGYMKDTSMKNNGYSYNYMIDCNGFSLEIPETNHTSEVVLVFIDIDNKISDYYFNNHSGNIKIVNKGLYKLLNGEN